MRESAGACGRSNRAPPPFTCSIVLDACSGGSCYGGDREPNARRPLRCYAQTSTIGIIFWRASLVQGLVE
jgi:hypothetical protein